MGARNGRPPGSNGFVAAVPDLRWEHAFWRGGLTRVAGVDEVGPRRHGRSPRRRRGGLPGVRRLGTCAGCDRHSPACATPNCSPRSGGWLCSARSSSQHSPSGSASSRWTRSTRSAWAPANRIAMERSVLGHRGRHRRPGHRRMRARSGVSAERTYRWRRALLVRRGRLDRGQGDARPDDDRPRVVPSPATGSSCTRATAPNCTRLAWRNMAPARTTGVASPRWRNGVPHHDPDRAPGARLRWRATGSPPPRTTGLRVRRGKLALPWWRARSGHARWGRARLRRSEDPPRRTPRCRRRVRDTAARAAASCARHRHF